MIYSIQLEVVVYISLYAYISIALHSGSTMYCIAAAAKGGGTVIVHQYPGSEDRFNPYNQWILICEHFYHSTKVQQVQQLFK